MMESKDTVMRVECHCEQLYKACSCSCDDCSRAKTVNKGREVQAEISFKAGYETYKKIAAEQLRAHGDVCHKTGIDMGRKEVVEKIRGIYKNANDFKELETRIKEYLDTTTSDVIQ